MIFSSLQALKSNWEQGMKLAFDRNPNLDVNVVDSHGNSLLHLIFLRYVKSKTRFQPSNDFPASHD